jgi:hypothetical protein
VRSREGRAIVWLRLHDLLLLGASRFKRNARSCLIFGHARQQTFTKAAAQNNRGVAPAWIVAQRDGRSFGRSRIAFGQSPSKPSICGVRSLCENWVWLVDYMGRKQTLVAISQHINNSSLVGKSESKSERDTDNHHVLLHESFDSAVPADSTLPSWRIRFKSRPEHSFCSPNGNSLTL